MTTFLSPQDRAIFRECFDIPQFVSIFHVIAIHKSWIFLIILQFTVGRDAQHRHDELMRRANCNCKKYRLYWGRFSRHCNFFPLNIHFPCKFFNDRLRITTRSCSSRRRISDAIQIAFIYFLNIHKLCGAFSRQRMQKFSINFISTHCTLRVDCLVSRRRNAKEH